MLRGLIFSASIPPMMPPKNTPGINSNPVFHDTNPSFEYAIRANTPVGGISATKDVPCARCWLNANSSPSKGTRSTPPPIPNIPEATPHTQAIAKMPALRPTPLPTGNILSSVGGCTALKLRLSPEQKSSQYQEATKQSFQVPRWHGERNPAPGISAE